MSPSDSPVKLLTATTTAAVSEALAVKASRDKSHLGPDTGHATDSAASACTLSCSSATGGQTYGNIAASTDPDPDADLDPGSAIFAAVSAGAPADSSVLHTTTSPQSPTSSLAGGTQTSTPRQPLAPPHSSQAAAATTATRKTRFFPAVGLGSLPPSPFEAMSSFSSRLFSATPTNLPSAAASTTTSLHRHSPLPATLPPASVPSSPPSAFSLSYSSSSSAPTTAAPASPSTSYSFPPATSTAFSSSPHPPFSSSPSSPSMATTSTAAAAAARAGGNRLADDADISSTSLASNKNSSSSSPPSLVSISSSSSSCSATIGSLQLQGTSRSSSNSISNSTNMPAHPPPSSFAPSAPSSHLYHHHHHSHPHAHSHHHHHQHSFHSFLHATRHETLPSVHELALIVSADIEIHRLWKTITEILSQHFYATRITLCMPHDSPLLNSTSTSTSDLSNPASMQPWGIKARWDYKQHFLDENTVTPKDEFAHKHHRLRTGSNASSTSSISVSAALPATLPSGAIPKGAVAASLRSNGSLSGRSSPTPSASGMSRKRNSSLSASHHHHHHHVNGSLLSHGSGGGNSGGAVPTTTMDITATDAIKGNSSSTSDGYHPQTGFWSTATSRHTDDGGYSSSSSCVSTYSSTSSNLPIQHPRGASVPPPPLGQSSVAGGAGGSSSSASSLLHPHYAGFPYGSGIECFATLQSLEYEPEPLLAEKTIQGIVQAGKTVVLTREYSASISSLRESRLFAAARRHGRPGFEGLNDDDIDDDDDDDDDNYVEEDAFDQATFDQPKQDQPCSDDSNKAPGSEQQQVGKSPANDGTDGGSSSSARKNGGRGGSKSNSIRKGRWRASRAAPSSLPSATGSDRVTPVQHLDDRDQLRRSAHEITSSLNNWDSEGSYFPPMDPALSSIGSNSSSNNHLDTSTPAPKTGYTDYIQGLNPTWSQSPAPSPNIMKEDPTINPFFQPLPSYPAMDDDTFDPPESTPDTTDDGNSSASECRSASSSFDRHVRLGSASLPRIQQPAVAAADNLRSLIHVPLYRSSDQNKQRFLPSDIQRTRPPAMPVGILSILSDQIPYPPEALDILMELNPFLANQVTNALRLEVHFAGSRRWGGSRSQLDSGFRSGPGSSIGDKLDRSSSGIGGIGGGGGGGLEAYVTSPSTSSLSLSLKQQGLGPGRLNPAASLSSTPLSDAGLCPGRLPSHQQSSPSRRRESLQPPNKSLTAEDARRELVEGEDDLETPRPLSHYQATTRATDKEQEQQYFDLPLRKSADLQDAPLSGPATTASGATSTPALADSITKKNNLTVETGNGSETMEKPLEEPSPGSRKAAPETFYNLDTTTDEIHRNLNMLSLDVTGGATCPFAPRSKKMLMVGRQTGSKAAMLKSPLAATAPTPYKEIEEALLAPSISASSSWGTSSRKRSETSPLIPRMPEGVDVEGDAGRLDSDEDEGGGGEEDMWQTLSNGEDTGIDKANDPNIRLPLRRESFGRSSSIADTDSLFGSSHESPYFASAMMPSISPSNTTITSSTKRHVFSTNKRSGLRRRRKSIKDAQKFNASTTASFSMAGALGSSGTPSHANDSSVPPSPLTPGANSDLSSTISSRIHNAFYHQPHPPERPLSAAGSVASECGYLSNDQLAFSPGASPMASPTPHDPDRLDPNGHRFKGSSSVRLSYSHRNHVRKGSTATNRSQDGESLSRKGSLGRHGSGWSINSDETTSVTSPGWTTSNDRNHSSSSTAQRKSRSKKGQQYNYPHHPHHHHFTSNERAGNNHFPRTQLLRLIVDAIAHHVFTLSPMTATLTWVNQRALQYAGMSQSQMVHSPWTIILHEDDRTTISPLFQECFDKGEVFNAQYRVRRFDGQYRWFLGRILPVRDYGGSIVHWFGTSTDIHDQKLAELHLNRQIELELSERKYRLLAEAIPQIVFTATPHIGLTYANAKWYTYSGQVYEQAYGLGFLDQVHPEDRAKCFLPNITAEDNDGPFPRPTNYDLGGAAPTATGGNTDASGHQKGSETPTTTTTSGSSAPSHGNSNTKSPGYKHSTSPGGGFGQSPGDVSYQTELRLKRKDGKFRWFLVKCISVEDGEQGRKWFGTCTDINDQKMLEHKLKEAHDAAQKSTESKTRFLSNMSHEIRTPLVGITGMINFLITTDLTSEQLDYVHTVQQSADALLLVINDILDLSKVEAGMMKLEMEPFSVHAMIEDANELLNTLAIQKGLELGFLVEDEVPEVVIGDRVRLRQVLLNIIGNAIKFTSKGEVFSRCSVVKPPLTTTAPLPGLPSSTTHPQLSGSSISSSSSTTSSPPGATLAGGGSGSRNSNEIIIKFEISDTGKGFDQSERAVMFKPFSQVDTSSTRKHGGTGLGLVLSKEFVELHGGVITCESEKHKGSKFSFTFKAKIPPPNVIPRATTPISDEKQKTVSYQYSAPQSAVGLSDVESRSGTPGLQEAGVVDGARVRSMSGSASGLRSPGDILGSPQKSKKIHITGVRLAPGEMCMVEPDRETALENAKRILESRTDDARETALMHGIDPDAQRRQVEAARRSSQQARELDAQQSATHAASATTAASTAMEATTSKATPMSRAESLLEERHNKLGFSSPNPPLGEPPSVAIIAANLPNPADEMTLRLPTKFKEAKALRMQKQQQHQQHLLQERQPADSSGELTSDSTTTGGVDGGEDQKGVGSQDSIGSSTDSTLSTSSQTVSTAPSSTVSLVSTVDLRFTRPHMLVIADFEHALETILHLIPKLAPSPSDFVPAIDITRNVKEGSSWLLGDEYLQQSSNKDGNDATASATTTRSKQPYNYVIISLAKYMEVLDLFAVMRQEGVLLAADAMTCVITTPIQRAALMEAIKAEEAHLEVHRTADTPSSEGQVIPSKIEWAFKPLTRSKLVAAFEELVDYHESLRSHMTEGGREGGGVGVTNHGVGGRMHVAGEYHGGGLPIRHQHHAIGGAHGSYVANSGIGLPSSSSADSTSSAATAVDDGSGLSRSQTNSPANNSSSNGSGGSKVSVKRQTAQQVVNDQKEIFTQMYHDLTNSGRTIRILLAEDNLVNQKVLKRYFQMIGAHLMIANDGSECVKIFEEKGPGFFNLVLCDLFMPGKDGYEATRAIREWEAKYVAANEHHPPSAQESQQQQDALLSPPAYKPIPIVALSANVMANVAERCLSSGFTSYLSKPVDFKKLSETIRDLVL